jgi:hypothetical protein
MKNKIFFAISFVVFAGFTFLTSKTKESDKPIDAVLIGILGASTTTLIFHAVSKAIEEEEYIDNNPTQYFDKSSKEVRAAHKFLSKSGNNYIVPQDNSDESSIFEDVTETGFYSERESKTKTEETKSNSSKLLK